MKRIFMLSAFIMTVQSLIAQIDKKKLDELFANYDTHKKAMLSMCISENETLIYNKSIGYSDIDKKEKANVFSLYHIGSITKMFTSVMIFQLIEEKKLRMETKLDKFFPSLPNSHKITISNLLNHRSGLFNFTSDSLYLSYNEKPMTEKELISLFEKQTPEFEPDSKSDYSNTNYVLLTFIIEKLTKNSYDKELIKRICSKINLSDTRVGVAMDDESNIAKSYQFENSNWVKSSETDMSIPRGAGAIVSTAQDLCKFIEALFAGKLISTNSLNEMKTIKDNYGYGIFQTPFGKKIGYGHTGGIDGFESMLTYFPDDKLALCIVGNGWNYPMNDVAIAVLSIYYKKDYNIPSFEKKIISGEEAKSIEGVYENSNVGMKINIKKEGEVYTAQATGQGAFPLDKVSELEYKFDPAQIKIIFIKDTEQHILSFKLIQSGHELIFEK